jgi:hypothetical protein
MWHGAKIPCPHNYGKTSKDTPLTPIILTLISKDDLELIKSGHSDREVRAYKIIRLFTEAYEQGTLLTHSDVAFLLNISISTVSRQAIEYTEKSGIVLPTRGVVYDIGRAMTHKRIIVELYRRGYQTPEIARKTNHSMTACDRYIKAYKKVEKLSDKMEPEEIAQILEMGISLVKEYINLINMGIN